MTASICISENFQRKSLCRIWDKKNNLRDPCNISPNKKKKTCGPEVVKLQRDYLKYTYEDQGCGSKAKCLPGTFKAPNFIPSIAKTRKKKILKVGSL